MRDFKFFIGVLNEELVWRTHSGRHTPIEWMTTRHINNALNCLRGEGDMEIPNPYFGKSNREWITLFTNELNRRND
jgi:hypothetical protein